MNWRIIKQFPKFAVVGAVFIISTGLFVFWWMTKKPARPQQERVDYRKIEKAAKVAALPAKMGWLALVGKDLYDVSTGERIFQDWLNGIPQRLFYQPETNKLMVQVERGIMRYGIDGRKDGAMGETSPPAFSSDGKRAMFVRDGDIWLADVDWNAFAFSNERQATKLGQFVPNYFEPNVRLFSEEALIMRLQNKLIRVDLQNGDIQPVKIPQLNVPKRRSPNGRYMLNEEGGKLCFYDVNRLEAKVVASIPERLSDVQWIDDDSCALILGATKFAVYNRVSGSLNQIATLPFSCSQIAQASPNGGYMLCGGRKGVAVVDLKRKAASDFGTPAQHFGWVSDDTLIYTRDVPNTNLRGTWLRTIGDAERLVVAEPYIAGLNGSGAVAPLRQVELVVFGTRDALYRMKPDGSELTELVALKRMVARIVAVEIWGADK